MSTSLRRFQGFVRRPSQPIRVRTSINSFNSNSFGMAGNTFFNGIGTYSNSSSSLASSILLRSLSSLALRRIISSQPYPLTLRNSSKPTAGNLTKHLTTRSLNNAACANGSNGWYIPLNTLSRFESCSVTVFGNCSISVVTVTSLATPERAVVQRYFWSGSGPAQVSVLTILLRRTDV